MFALSKSFQSSLAFTSKAKNLPLSWGPGRTLIFVNIRLGLKKTKIFSKCCVLLLRNILSIALKVSSLHRKLLMFWIRNFNINTDEKAWQFYYYKHLFSTSLKRSSLELIIFSKMGALFEHFIFFMDGVQMGPIRYSVCPWQAFPA